MKEDGRENTVRKCDEKGDAELSFLLLPGAAILGLIAAIVLFAFGSQSKWEAAERLCPAVNTVLEPDAPSGRIVTVREQVEVAEIHSSVRSEFILALKSAERLTPAEKRRDLNYREYTQRVADICR